VLHDELILIVLRLVGLLKSALHFSRFTHSVIVFLRIKWHATAAMPHVLSAADSTRGYQRSHRGDMLNRCSAVAVSSSCVEACF
jgi:hypothetical protein